MAIDVNCPFCSQNNFNLPIRETFRHLYFDCTVTSNIWQIFRTRYMQGSTVEHCTRQIFFGIMPNEEFLEIQLVISLLFLHCIWMCRLSRKISFTTVENNMAFYQVSVSGYESDIKRSVNHTFYQKKHPHSILILHDPILEDSKQQQICHLVFPNRYSIYLIFANFLDLIIENERYGS